MSEQSEFIEPPPPKRQKVAETNQSNDGGSCEAVDDFSKDVDVTEDKRNYVLTEDKYNNYVTPEELERLKEFKVLDEVRSNDEDSNNEESDSSDGKSEGFLVEEEIEKMLEEDLPDDFKVAPKPKEKPYVTRQKICLEEKGVNHFEVLPLDWIVARHYSGMPIYMHRATRVCTLSKPYFLGKGNTRRHDIPISAIPCLAYRRALIEEEKQKEIDRHIEEQIKNGTYQQKANDKPKCPFAQRQNAGQNTSHNNSTTSNNEDRSKCPFKSSVGKENGVRNESSQECPVKSVDKENDGKDESSLECPVESSVDKENDERSQSPTESPVKSVDKENDERNESSLECPVKSVDKENDEKIESNTESDVAEKENAMDTSTSQDKEGELPNDNTQAAEADVNNVTVDNETIIDEQMNENVLEQSKTIECKNDEALKQNEITDDQQSVSINSDISNEIAASRQNTNIEHENQAETTNNETNDDPSNPEGDATKENPNPFEGDAITENPNPPDGETIEIPLNRQPVVLPGGIVMPPPRVETVSTSWKTQHLTPEQLNDYCKKLFKFKTVNVMHFKRWADRRKYTKARKTLQYPTLPEGTKLITIPGNGNDGGKANKRDWVMNMNGRSYLSVFHEYVRRALQKQPVYEFKQLENASTPYQATVYIGGMQYGVGHGSSKRAAKSAAARASIHILIPEMAADLEPHRTGEPDFTFFDMVGIEDPRITEFCAATCEPSPHAILRTCLLRNFGAGDRHIHTEMKKLEYQKIELTMKVGKHSATVVCKNKKTAKQRASQAILQALHPHVRSWGSLLRLYGSRSVKSCKEKKLEEQQITLLQDAARHNEPNYAVLEKLRHEMRKLKERDGAVVPIGTLLLKEDLPTHSGSNLNNVDL